MEGTLSLISPAELYGRLGTASAPAVIDVRRPADFATASELIISAYHRDPDKVEQWGKRVASRPPGGRPLRSRTRGQPRRGSGSPRGGRRRSLSPGWHQRLDCFKSLPQADDRPRIASISTREKSTKR